MAASPARTVTLKIGGPLERTDLPGLFERACTLLEGSGIDLLRCEVADVATDAVAVDALARLALAARRRGCAIHLCGASPELGALVAFMGLAEVLREDPTSPAAGEDEQRDSGKIVSVIAHIAATSRLPALGRRDRRLAVSGTRSCLFGLFLGHERPGE
ncbi:MAG TPA: hypothetical protein VFC30_09710 [Solirubrobacteraceae bacterium]|nr:hypothetical protein [Solirubrobacteraceae bacterium]